ncbi:MAG: chromosome condensation regulator [Hyperionvirus sp.]|uniref:Chromosome condensation regulator n=1 Tax=Hyperionvirus sp. TaxID=2487770 RepID=A0A3G5ACD8_9VIRU|nr:MAG: chromosome condensation regulator [Hyperionvirus sp.]
MDLQYIITNYNPEILFTLPSPELSKYDWFKLLKMNFSLNYPKEKFTNEEIMKIYRDNIISRKFKIICHEHVTIIKLPNGSLFSSGYDYYGKLARINTGRFEFTEISGLPKTAVAEVISGEYHTIIRLRDGTLMSSGSNTFGQLGHGDKLNRISFSIIKGIPNNIIEMVCGRAHTIIRLTDGTLMSCGSGIDGQLGLGDDNDRNIFWKIIGIPKNVEEVLCGPWHTVIKLTDGTLLASGYNMWGQLGLGDERSRKTFTQIPHIPKNIAKVMCYIDHTIIQLTNGTLMACGYNALGQLGLGHILNKKYFTEISNIPQNIVEIASCTTHTILRCEDGKLFGSGSNSDNELFLPDNVARYEFTEITAIPKNIAQIICSPNKTIIRLTDGTIINSANTKTKGSPSPKMHVSNNIMDMVSCHGGTIIRLTDGTLISCGNNRYGQLGTGTNTDNIDFVRVRGIPNILSREE